MELDAPTEITTPTGMSPAPTVGNSAVAPKSYSHFSSLFLPAGMDACNDQPEVSLRTALSMEVIYAAISILVDLVGMTDLILYRRTRSGAEEATEHLSYRAGRYKVNDIVKTSSWLETTMYHALTSHGAFSRIGSDAAGNTTLTLLPSDYMGWGMFFVDREDGTRGLEFFYTYTCPQTFKPTFYRADEITHVKGFSIDGINGTNPIGMCPDTLGLMLSCRRNLQTYQASGGAIKGYFVVPPGLDPKVMVDAIETLGDQAKMLHRETGMKVAPLPSGVEFIPLTNNARDAEMSSLADMDAKRAARLFKIPVDMLGEETNSSFNSLSIQTQRLLLFALQPWYKRIEDEFNDKILFDGQWESGEYFFRFDRRGLFQGSWNEICQCTRELYAIGLLGFKESREALGFDTRPDDWFAVPVNQLGSVMWNPSSGQQFTIGGPSPGVSQIGALVNESDEPARIAFQENVQAMNNVAMETAFRCTRRIAGIMKTAIKNDKYEKYQLFNQEYYQRELNACYGLFGFEGDEIFPIEETFLAWFPDELKSTDLESVESSLADAHESTQTEFLKFLRRVGDDTQN